MRESASGPVRGLFNRGLAGMRTPTVTVSIERGRIRFFSKVLGEMRGIHHDVQAALAAGFADLVAPPSFPAVVEEMADEERRRRGLPAVLALIGCDMRLLLHGSESYSYYGQIMAGDELEVVTDIVGFSDKKGGALELAELQTRMSHPARGLLVSTKRILIHRLA